MTFISKEAILIFDQSQIVFMKNILLSKNSDLITLEKDLTLAVSAHKKASLCGSYIRYEIEEQGYDSSDADWQLDDPELSLSMF